jgi:cation diffusion facilitator family transporter
VIAAFFALWAIRVSHLPADDNHPFGHHKAEYLSAVVEGAMIIVAALLIFREAFFALESPAPLERPWPGLAVNAIGGVLNAIWALALIRTGRQERSPALDADGRHILTDVWTSAGVIVGLIAAVATGWTILDPLLAIVVAVNILYQGWRVIGASVQGLMDVGVDAERSMRIREIISTNAGGALEVHDLKTRIAGRATFIEFHLVVDAAMSVGDSHVICDRIEAALKSEIPSVRVVIHVEPDDEAKLPKGTTSVPFA